MQILAEQSYLCWNKALLLAVASHMTSFNQIKCSILAWHSYSILQFFELIDSSLLTNQLHLDLSLWKTVDLICKIIPSDLVKASLLSCILKSQQVESTIPPISLEDLLCPYFPSWIWWVGALHPSKRKCYLRESNHSCSSGERHNIRCRHLWQIFLLCNPLKYLSIGIDYK